MDNEGVHEMAHYLVEATYAPGAVGGMIAHPQDRREAIKPIVERMGGKVEAFYFVAGETAAVVIMELPDDVAATSFAMAVTASGAVRSFTSRALLTVEESMRAMGAAAQAEYRPPTTGTP
ncbi:MAG: hypothetical protein C0506_02070 [Anaerolinea sp.]|nr:hypothetical protein [Anaerolinea sp.]